MSESTAYRTAQGSDGRAEFFVDAVEHTVDEAARLFRPELLGDLDRFVDGDLRRHVIGPQELVDRQPENIAIDHGHPLEIPVLGELRDHLVDLRLVRLGATNEGVTEHVGLLVDRVARPEVGLVSAGVVLAVQFELVQELERDLARLPAAAHLSGALRPPWTAGGLSQMHVAPTRPFTRRRSTPGIWSRSAVLNTPDPFRHLQRCLGGFLAAIADLAAGAGPRLLLGERGDHAEGRRHAVRDRDLPDAGSGLARDVREVRSLASDDDTHAHDPGEPPGRRQMARGLWQLERSRHPVHLDGVRAEPRGAQGAERARHEPLRDAFVEAGRDDGKPHGPGAPGGPAKLRSAGGHLSQAVKTTSATACRASCRGTYDCPQSRDSRSPPAP